MGWLPVFLLWLLSGTHATGGAYARVSIDIVELPWAGAPESWQSALQRLRATSDADIRDRMRREADESRLYLRPIDVDISACAALALVSGNQEAGTQARRALGIALQQYDSFEPEALAGMVSERGSIDSRNRDARDACYHFGLRYRLTGSRSDATRAKVLLSAFAERLPKWPFWNPYYAADDQKKASPQSDDVALRDAYAAGLWGAWIYQDLIQVTPLMQAYRWIQASGEVSTEEASRIEALFRLFLDIQRRRGGAEFTNMDAFKIRGLVSWGLLMRDPDVVHEGIWHLQSIYRAGFFPDGWWHEGSPVYHSDLQNGLRSVARELLSGYSDPTDYGGEKWGGRIDRLDPLKYFGEKPTQADIVTSAMTLPSGSFLAIHDTDWQTRSNKAPPPIRRSVLHGCFGQATLVCGTQASPTLATLHWSGSGVHAHWDALNFNLWTKGVEVISETQYQPMPGTNSTREWHTSTAGHVTVVVDEKSQSNSGPLGRAFRDKRSLDGIPGIPDWPWRFQGENASDFGELELCNFGFPQVQVVKAAAPRSYQSVVSLRDYSRLITLVRIDDRDSYVLDVFRVRGGSIHDYMLHAALQLPHGAETTVALQARDGTLHEYLGNLRSGKTDRLWLSAFDLGNQLKLFSFVCPSPSTEVILADGPAMRRAGSAPYIVVRRTAEESTFVVIHHVTLAGPPRIRSIDLIPCNNQSDVAVRVELNDRVDVVVSSEDRNTSIDLGDGMRVRARFAHFSASPDANTTWGYMVDGDLMQTRNWIVEGDTAQQGLISETRRRDRGDAQNGLITDAPVALGGVVGGETIIVKLADLATWGFEILSCEPAGSGSALNVAHDPGFEIIGDQIKQYGFPNWGTLGVANYRIPGSALVESGSDGALRMRATGAAQLRTVSK
ncbi:MAG: heparinase II/III domain-containing protein [Phycisphaerales bacterium]|jgi:hypothetical protein